jgi:predicted TIM-barrel fold metal-dependent hydrolase
MKFYDAHIHFFYEGPVDQLRQTYALFEKIGLGGLDALILAEFPPEIETLLKMIPGLYHKDVTDQTLQNQRDPFPALRETSSLRIIPFLDARFIGDGIEEKIEAFTQRGFQGLKLLYVPEEDPVIRVEGMEKAFGRTLKRSEEVTSSLIESASRRGMPILLHVDLRKHGAFVSEQIGQHPQINFNIPHFGFSRREIGFLLESYPNCYTDLSSLAPFMKEDSGSYEDFIRRYQDRILFGSDALISQPETVQSALIFLGEFLNDQEIFLKLVNKNYLKFHRLPEEK